MSEKKITNTTEEDFNFGWLGGGNPGAIEAQEARGQKELVESSQLPIKKNSPYDLNLDTKEIYTKLGIKVIEHSDGDGLFYDVELPKGWKIESTDHSMWNNLIDDKGRERASIFYKAAFYDRDAFINFHQRYFSGQEYLKEKDGDSYPKFYMVKDLGTGEILFKTDVTLEYEDEELRKKADKWIKKHYPKHKSIFEYWD